MHNGPLPMTRDHIPPPPVRVLLLAHTKRVKYVICMHIVRCGLLFFYSLQPSERAERAWRAACQLA
jgi:hypothetical protein